MARTALRNVQRQGRGLLLKGVVVLSGLMLMGNRGTPRADGPPLEGEIVLTMRGPGAAPFGIASAFISGTGFAYNLARLHRLRAPAEVKFGNPVERYMGVARFTLVPDGSRRWVLDTLEVTYDFSCRSVLEWDGVVCRDNMRDGGVVRFSEGRWSGPPGSGPSRAPRIELRLAYGPETHALERMRTRVRRFMGGPGEEVRYELVVDVPHPMRPTGTSVMQSPLGTIWYTAKEGRLTLHADSPIGNMAVEGNLLFADLLESISPIDARDMRGTAEGTGQMLDQLRRGLVVMADPGIDFTLSTQSRGMVRDGRIEERDVFRTMTGAMAVKSVSLTLHDFELEPVDRFWWPEDGNRVEVRVRSPSPDTLPARIRYTLYEVTREIGTCINSRDRSRALDLHVRAADNPHFRRPVARRDGWRIATRRPVRDVDLVVRSRDYGAWGKVRADAWVGGIWLPLRVRGSERDYVTVPLDEEGGENRIADSWETLMGLNPGKDPRMDFDNIPESDFPGDGLSLYEEYRGAYVQGRHKRFDPHVKDLFVHVDPRSGLTPHVRRAGRLLEGIELHLVRAIEMESVTKRRINPNRGEFSVGDQHGLYIVNVPWRAGISYYGRAIPRVGSPQHVERVEIVKQFHKRFRAGRRVLDRENLYKTIAHGIFHGINVVNHGRGDYILRLQRRFVQTPSGREERYIPSQTGRGHLYNIAVERGQHSGDQQCIMAYAIATAYAHRNWDANALIYLYPLVYDDDNTFLRPFRMPSPVVLRLCRDSSGTFYNAHDQQVGHADFGNCMRQIRVRDAD